VEPAPELVRRAYDLLDFLFLVLVEQCVDGELVIGRAFFDLGGRDEFFVQCAANEQLGGARADGRTVRGESSDVGVCEFGGCGSRTMKEWKRRILPWKQTQNILARIYSASCA
jgi:hypothetical protein